MIGDWSSDGAVGSFYSQFSDHHSTGRKGGVEATGFEPLTSSLQSWLPLETLDKYIAKINDVTTDDVTAFAKSDLATPASTVIAGKAADFLEALKKNAPDARVIEQKKLDLNRADLRKM